MKRQAPQSIADVLRTLLEETSLQNRMNELKAASMWRHVVGDGIATQCSVPSVNDGVMRVGVPNASLRNELLMNRSRLRQIINSKVGKDTIKEIKFTS